MNKEHKERAATDRRDDDIGPPCGWKDRRHNTERRIPTVEEQTMTEAEWLSYFGAPVTESTEQSAEAAADILGRART
ncbi:MAG: hypothetical protein KGP14_04770 [Betaproteobacteria bacterium]|nr:hypothetical protein [Betaproteobacteria bacterium]